MIRGGPDLDALVAGCLAAPADDAPRLVLADYLEERGDPRGELLRKRTRHLVRFWGLGATADVRAIRDSPSAALFHIEDEGLAYAAFCPSAEDVAGLREYLATGDSHVDTGEFGNTPYLRTIAAFDLVPPGSKAYQCRIDFGFGYPDDPARYMLEDGNYSCDCNRSLFLRDQAGWPGDEAPCGESIRMENLVIRYEV
jgi:uncharacterized protein (TIGR02996 family)